MKNKTLIILICILFPIAVIISFKNTKKEETKNKKIIKNYEIKVKLTKTNEIKTLNLEDYILGVIAAEMPAAFELEALKAQAVASRSYALANKKNNKEYDFDDTIANQAFITKEEMNEKWGEDFNKYFEKLKTAINETKSLVMKYNDKIITAFYFSMSNGYTEDSVAVFKQELPYINSVESTWEKNNTNFLYTKRFDKEEFCNKLNISCTELVIKDLKRNESNRVSSLSINNKTILGVDFRTLFSIRSTDFEIKQEKNQIIIITRGYGHGVGMSQYGANGMAKEGNDYKDILNYYYKGIKIEKI